MDGDLKLSQTFAILKYLGRKHNMKANNDAEQIRLDLIEAEAVDMRMKWSMLVYSPEFVIRNSLSSSSMTMSKTLTLFLFLF